MKSLLFLFSLVSFFHLAAQLKLPAIFSDGMVLQQKQKNFLWGWDQPGQTITVTLTDSTLNTVADDQGSWKVQLPEKPASFTPYNIHIKGSSSREIKDVLFGEVWLCSGQSNMAMNVSATFDSELTSLLLNGHSPIKIISVPQVASQTPLNDFEGKWELAQGSSIYKFSAVGLHFGKALSDALHVPIGLINCSWGGSTCQAWMNPSWLNHDPAFAPILLKDQETDKAYDEKKAAETNKNLQAKWESQKAEAIQQKKPLPPSPKYHLSPLQTQYKTGNLYYGCLNPIISYGIRGTLWYQGEGNSSDYTTYEKLLPTLIQNWRSLWKQGDFPFYIVQLSSTLQHNAPVNFNQSIAHLNPPTDHRWAFMRDAQWKIAQKTPHTGIVCTTDLGAAKDVHPKNKRPIGERLARLALVNEYQLPLKNYRSPELDKITVKDNQIIVDFKYDTGGLISPSLSEIIGFAVAGNDQVWQWAKASLKTHQNRPQVVIEIPSGLQPPYHLRYNWSAFPSGNLCSAEGLPLMPFRTDDWLLKAEDTPAKKPH
jgi:sialate O-acetylesterase